MTMKGVGTDAEMSVCLNAYARVVHTTVIMFCKPRRKSPLRSLSHLTISYNYHNIASITCTELKQKYYLKYFIQT